MFLGDDFSVTLETDSIMQEIKQNPTFSRNFLGAGGDPAAHDLIHSLEQKVDDFLGPKMLRLQDENDELVNKLYELGGTVETLTETIRQMEIRETEAKVRRREGRNNFVNDDDFYESLSSLKSHWQNIFSDIEHKLSEHAKGLAEEKEFSDEDLQMVEGLKQFHSLLSENLHAFEPEETVEATMDKLYPRFVLFYVFEWLYE